MPLTSVPTMPYPPVIIILPLTTAALAPSNGLGNSGPWVQSEEPRRRNSVEERELWNPGRPPAATSICKRILSYWILNIEETFTVLWFQLLRFEVELTMASSLRAKLEQARPSRASCSWGSSSTNSPRLVYLGQKKSQSKSNLLVSSPCPSNEL